MNKIPEKDEDLIKITKLVYGFRENQEFIFRIIRFLEDIRTSNLSFAIKEKDNIYNKIDNSFYYFISNNLYDNFFFGISKYDEFLSLIYRLMIYQINKKYEYFLEDNSVLSNIFKSMLIQIDIKERFKIILDEILLKMEELSDEEWLLDISNINQFIFKLYENRGPITQKVKNMFLKPRNDILKKDERLFRKYINFNIKDSIAQFDEKNKNNMKGYVDKINSLLDYNEEKNYDIIHFFNIMKYTSNQNLAMNIYRHYFFIVRKILHLIIDTLIRKINHIPYIIKCICKMIEIIGNNEENKLTNFDILSLIGKYFFNNIIKLFLFNERYIAMMDFAPISNYSKKNYNMIKIILSNLQSGNLFSINNFPNLIPFNYIIYNELLPKLVNFYKLLSNVDFSPYLNDLITGRIKENNFSYDYFKFNHDNIFRNMSICFNINNYHSFLILLKIFTSKSKDIIEFYKKGDINCINNMKKYYGDLSDYKEITSFTGPNSNKEPNIFHLYYKIISKYFDLQIDYNSENFIFYLPEKDIRYIESEEEFKENEIIKMKNLLCLLLYKMKELNKEDFSLDHRKNLLSIIKRIIFLSKEDVIGNILMILIKKSINNDFEFNYTLFEELKYHIHNNLIHNEDYYMKYKVNEYLRIINLQIKELIKNNEQLLLYNSYLDVENYLQKNQFYKSQNTIKTNNNLNDFISDFFNIKDSKLRNIYEQTTNNFVDIKKEFIFPNYYYNEKANPKQVNAIINYMNEASKGVNEKYQEIIVDFISSKIYDCLINHKPDKEDIMLFNELIKDNLHYEIYNKTNIEQKVMKNIIINMKKFEKFRGVYQKKYTLSNLNDICSNYFYFLTGKKELNDMDDKKKLFFKFIISKIYSKSLIGTSKYICLFEKGYDYPSIFKSLTSILYDLRK